MSQISVVGFGSDPTLSKVAAKITANDRLGKLELEFENLGNNSAYIQLKELNSGVYTDLGSLFEVKPLGVLPKSLVLISKTIGFFGYGNTTVNIHPFMRNPANLRGAQWDIEIEGRKSWSFDPAYNTDAVQPIVEPIVD